MWKLIRLKDGGLWDKHLRWSSSQKLSVKLQFGDIKIFED